MSSTQITPQQSLLSTIYKQSWHPVASTKFVINRGPKRPKEIAFVTRGSHKTPKSRYMEACMSNPKQSSRIHTSHLYSKVPKVTGPQIPSETSFTIFTTNTNDPDLQALSSSPSSLSNWKRQLRTCIDSNASKADRKPTSESDCGKTLKERLLSARYQKLCVNDSASKCYKVLNYQNSTLASICVQGKDPPKKPRSGSRTRTSSTGSHSSIATRARMNPVVTRAGVTATRNDSPVTSQAPVSETALTRRYSSSTLDTEPEAMEDESTTVDEVFDRNLNDNEENFKDCFGNTDFEEECSKNDVLPNLDLMSLNFPQDSEDSDSDNESDISEQEISSEDDIDNDDLSLNQKESDANSKFLVEKFKELYKNENKAKSILQDDENLRKSKIKKFETSSTIQGDNNKSRENSEEKYEFGAVFPKQFEKYNLKELSMLPYDVNWRNVVRFCDLCPDDRSKLKTSCVARQRHARSPRVAQERNRMETLVDRLLILEKLKVSTRQSELMARYHVAHVRAAAAKTKAQNGRVASSTVQGPKPTDSNLEPVINRSPTRRRSSASISSARLAWANEISQGGENILKEANRSGDFTAVLDDWSTKNRPSKCVTDRSRRSSDCSRSIHRSRPRYMHPRFYEYSWSERTKDDKNRVPTYWGGRTRSCPTCREKWRKLNASLIQERKRRPSTASVASTWCSRYQTGTERLPFRPYTHHTHRNLGQPLATTLQTTSSNNQRSLKSTSLHENSSGLKKETAVTATTSSPASESNVRPYNRPSFFTSAFKISSVSISKRS